MSNCKYTFGHSLLTLTFFCSLSIKLAAFLQINRIDLAEKTLLQMKSVDEDSCLVVLAQCWITLYNNKAPINCCEQMIQSLNELSDKFGYTLKTYNILGIILMIQGETQKASQIFENALNENDIFNLQDGDPLLNSNNYELASIIYNYIKCNAIMQAHSSMIVETYR